MLEALGDVLSVAGRPEEAEEELREALALYERKGNVAAAGKIRDRFAKLGEGASSR